MMKIAICALLVAGAFAATVLPLSGLAAAPANPAFTLTATYPAPAPTITVTAFSGITTYNAAGPVPATVGAVTMTITYSANLNQSVGASASYTSGSNTNTVQWTGLSSTTTAGVTTTVYTNTGTTQIFRFDAAGSFPVVLSGGTDLGYLFPNLGVPSGATGTTVVVTGAYTPPVLATFHMITPNGCTTTGCTDAPNATATITPVTSSWSLSAYFRANTPTQSGVFITSSGCDPTSLCNFGSGFATAWSGSFGGFLTGGGFTSQGTLTAGNTLVPMSGTAVGSGSIFDSRQFFSTWVSESTFGALQGAITFPVGSADVTAPTCTSAIFVPALGTTVDENFPAEFAIICADTGGSGLYRKGAFGTVNRGSFTSTLSYNQAGGAVSVTEEFPPYVSGQLQIVGVWAVDNALNSVLYGSCGDATGYSTIGCSAGGGGGSSASTVSLSLFALFSLVVMSLFA